MTTLFGTGDAWVSTARSIRWSAVVAPPVAASLCIVALGALAEVDPVQAGLVGEPGLAFAAVAPAFIADDVTTLAAPGTPVEAPARLLLRAALVAPVTIVGWLVVLSLYTSVASGVPVDIAQRGVLGLGLASVALAFAAVAGRSRAVVSPGMAGMAAVATLAVLVANLPQRWLTHLPAGDLLWPIAIVISVAVIAIATREPART